MIVPFRDGCCLRRDPRRPVPGPGGAIMNIQTKPSFLSLSKEITTKNRHFDSDAAQARLGVLYVFGNTRLKGDLGSFYVNGAMNTIGRGMQGLGKLSDDKGMELSGIGTFASRGFVSGIVQGREISELQKVRSKESPRQGPRNKEPNLVLKGLKVFFVDWLGGLMKYVWNTLVGDHYHKLSYWARSSRTRSARPPNCSSTPPCR